MYTENKTSIIPKRSELPVVSDVLKQLVKYKYNRSCSGNCKFNTMDLKCTHYVHALENVMVTSDIQLLESLYSKTLSVIFMMNQVMNTDRYNRFYAIKEN